MRLLLARALALAAAVAILPACDPDDIPRFAPDGRAIAFLWGGAVGLADVETGKVRKLPLPESGSAAGLVWAGTRLLVFSSRPTGKLDVKGQPELETQAWRLDPAGGAAERTERESLLGAQPFHGLYKGERCLYVPATGPGRVRILALPDLKERAVLAVDAEHAGDGWMAVSERREAANGLTRDLVAVRILDPEGKDVGRLPREEIEKACYRGARFPACARVSDDHRRVVLGFDTDTLFRQMDAEYTFGVYELQSGKLAFQGKSNALRGPPVLIGEAVYALEARERQIHTGERGLGAPSSGAPPRSRPTSDVVLARHTKEGRRVVLELPLGPGSLASACSASEDRKLFVLQVGGESPRLLLIPVSDAATREQVREIPLP